MHAHLFLLIVLRLYCKSFQRAPNTWFSEHLLLHRVPRPRPGNCCDRCEAKLRNHSRGPQQSSGQRQVQRSLLIWLVGSPTFHDSSSLWLSRQLFSANPDTVVTLYISPGVYKLNYSRENDTVDFSNIKPGINIYSYLSEGSLLTRKSM